MDISLVDFRLSFMFNIHTFYLDDVPDFAPSFSSL